MNKRYIVIGSGPAGISAAKALLARNVPVIMLDVGIELEQERQDVLEELQSQWDEKRYATLKHNINTQDDIKLSYGSDYPYQKVSQHYNIVTDKKTHCTPSFARGGLSNVWGAYTALYDDDDLQSWPIKTAELSPYYQKILEMIPISKNHRGSQQADLLLKNINRHDQLLKSAGFTIKPAQLSVYFDGKSGKSECFYCGNCQHGCPNRLIYSVNDSLQELQKNKQFTYIKNMVVKKIIEHEHRVQIFANELSAPDKMITFTADRVFLAAGAIISTAILLNSLNLYDHSIVLKQSQHFMLPCLMKSAIPQVETEKLHTLTQFSLRLQNNAITHHPAHVQIYTYMDHYTQQFHRIFKKAYPLIKPFLNPIINRLIVIQGYFHSTDSPECEMQLSNDGKTISLQGAKNSIHVRKKITALNHHLMKFHKELGFIPIGFMTKFSKVLRSNHYGGSFPMQVGERALTTTDLLGRPYGMQKVHVVDATVFPTIPAQAITITIMANAYRIASEFPL